MDDPSTTKLHRFKHRLGVFRKPMGVFFLVLTFLLVITPFTPGSWLTLAIGLELLDLREWAYKKFARKSKK